jgi:glyoxylase-like metal-dependent hydrolase (beta-lactamase superfamily II)
MPGPTRVSRFGIVNTYLVREDDGLTAIDTMIPRSAGTILDAARGMGAPITRIVLTHAHADHVGSLDALAAELPDAEVIISSRDARLLRKDKSLDPGEPQTKVKGGFPGTRTEPTRTVEEGERIGSLEVVSSPGHTPGHIALVDTRDRTLFCGDVFSTLGGVATSSKLNPRFPLPYLATWHPPTNLESARKLRALDPGRLAPGHGKVVEDPAAAMDAAIARAT